MKTLERVSISAFVDVDDHERLVERALVEDRSVSAELRQAIREHLLSRGRVGAVGVSSANDVEDNR
jgi:hypothetical protein